MKNVLHCLLFSIVAGCSWIQPPKVVAVSKPLMWCPAPPKMPNIEYEVDKLSPSDENDPGKVGKAYKHDMMALRALVAMYQEVWKGYESFGILSQQTNKEINDAFDSLMRSLNTPQAPSN